MGSESSTLMVSAAATPSAKIILGSSRKCRRKSTVKTTPIIPEQVSHVNMCQGEMCTRMPAVSFLAR